MLNLLPVLFFAVGLGFFIYQRTRFNNLYEEFLQESMTALQVSMIEEDEFTYNVMLKEGGKSRVNKKGGRNMPSQNKELTLLVGFTRGLFNKQPFQVFYYNMLDLSYDEKYRLRKKHFTRVPRVLRAFTWTNLKVNSKNFIQLLFANIFGLTSVAQIVYEYSDN